MTESWQLRLYGAPALCREAGGDTPAAELALARKDAALLAWAALDGPLPSARVAEALWPDAGGRGGLNNLRQRLHRLRRASGARLLEMTEVLILAADLASPQADEAALAADPAAWDAELLAGCDYGELQEFSAWLQHMRVQRALRRRQALAGIAQAAEAAGELARALRYAQRLLAEEPLSEHAHRRLMRLHYLRGDSAAAVAAFEACEVLLKDQLGLRPGAETLTLLQAVEHGRLPAARPTAPVPTTLLRPPRLVGREAETARLAQAHADGDVVVLVGEAGMGKSRMLQDFAAAQPGVLRVQARPGDAGVPYGLVARLLHALDERLPGALDAEPALAPLRAGTGATPGPMAGAPAEALTRVLRTFAQLGDASLVLDDLHFADVASLELIEALLQVREPVSLRWLLAHRPPDETSAPTLRAIEELERVRWIVLQPLTALQLQDLLDDLALPGLSADPAALAGALARHTGGNPLFALETLRAMLADGGRGAQAGEADAVALPRPDAIERLIDRRLRRLSPPARDLLRVAAVSAPDFSPELAEFVLGRPALSLAEAWRELEQADVMRGSAFAHDLVQDAALRAIPAAIASHEHARVARYLQDRDAEPARVATHWQAAARWRPAAQAFERAAARAAAASRLREQAVLLQDAVRCHLAAGDAEAAGRPGAAAVEALLLSAGAEAARSYADALLAEPLPDAAAARVLVARAGAQYQAGQWQDSGESARAALARAGDTDPALKLGAVRRLAMALAVTGQVPQALALLEPWRGRFAQGLPREDWMHLNGDLTNLLLGAGRFAEALPVAECHLALARELEAGSERMNAMINLSSLKMLKGDAEGGIALAREADALLPQSQQQLRSLRTHNRMHLGATLALVGDYGAALALLEEVLTDRAGQPAGDRLRIGAQNFLARALITLGQPARAQSLLAGDALALPPAVQATRLAAQAALAAALGRDEAPLLRQALELCRSRGGVHERLFIELDLLPYASDDAARLAASVALQREAEELGFNGVAAAAAVQRIDALRALCRLDEAAHLLPAAEQAAWRWRRAYLPALLRLCTEAYAALGLAQEARRCLVSALDWVHASALPSVPLAWRDGFLQRNPHNCALASLARRLGAGTQADPPALSGG